MREVTVLLEIMSPPTEKENIFNVPNLLSAYPGNLRRCRRRPVRAGSCSSSLGCFFSYAVALARFRKIPGLHLYSCVSAGYLQGIFLFVLFAWGFRLWLYYLATVWGTLAYAEKTIVLFLLDDIAPRTKGLYWLIRKRRSAGRA